MLHFTGVEFRSSACLPSLRSHKLLHFVFKVNLNRIIFDAAKRGNFNGSKLFNSRPFFPNPGRQKCVQSKIFIHIAWLFFFQSLESTNMIGLFVLFLDDKQLRGRYRFRILIDFRFRILIDFFWECTTNRKELKATFEFWENQIDARN